ncbi:hypothetical protein CPHO_09535 [Corynebacterium phocae]|uniref:Uncharacterized protein n=1 Tax=Corynebacterium phocae TaxID=161895 RepID=A0A1L7D4U6_9CORY|nr:hypothetical protein [Corynebacterium phocae]APT93087.1 hypothetical protein CPHO_09535 [Corynebacterium phocae]KAA8722390.1 hypothetical protein F4V58_09005 [Corynebacterium phocae]
MTRWLVSLLLTTGISVTSASAVPLGVAQELPVHSQSAAEVATQPAGGQDDPAQGAPAPGREPQAEAPLDTVSWPGLLAGAAALLSPAGLALLPVDWAQLAEALGSLG